MGHSFIVGFHAYSIDFLRMVFVVGLHAYSKNFLTVVFLNIFFAWTEFCWSSNT